MKATADIPAAPVPPAVVSGEPDLWCTYAAVRTLRWLNRVGPPDGPVFNLDGTASYLATRRNADGGYAWSRGMPSDAWATFYSLQGLRDLGRPASDLERTGRWLERTWSGDAYAMMPGQRPDVWATHFSTRTTVEACGNDVPDRGRLLAWLAALQTPSGGLTWSPDHSEPDVRACYYGIAAWRAVAALAPAPLPWDASALVGWLTAAQGADGGFRFTPQAELPCLWATYRASAALNILGAQPLGDTAAFIRALHGSGGGFVRWPGYAIEDVWAAFCAVGALAAIGERTEDVALEVTRCLAGFACPEGGFTYREPSLAGDALTAAAAVLSRRAARAEVVPWLESCQLPNEAGLMYMPGRGSEIRCTLWGLAAGAFASNSAARDRIAEWLYQMQNPDGGFGYWEGRASDLVSTSAGVAVAELLDRPLDAVVNTAQLARFVRSCRSDGGYANVPGATPTMRASAQALRVCAALGEPDRAAARTLLDRHRVRGGGYANEGNRVPDLLSTYEAVLTADVHGIAVDVAHIRQFIDRVATAKGTAWTPLGPPTGGALADCLVALLRARVDDAKRTLPPLTLS